MTPIVIFAYNRPAHLARMVASLKLNKECADTDLFVHSDGPKSDSDIKLVSEVRTFARLIDGFKSVTVIQRKENYGLAKSVLSTVDDLFNTHETLIVLEDDLLLSKFFLSYMNQGLSLYADEPQVASIHGYRYPTRYTLPNDFFLRGADCLGWATWQRVWDNFEKDGQVLLNQLKSNKLTKAFDFDGTSKFTSMLKDQIKGKNNSWAIRWYAWNFLQNHLTLYPGESLVDNIGFDDSGTHCGMSTAYRTPVSNVPISLEKQSLIESQVAREAFKDFFRGLQPGYTQRLKRKIISYVKAHA